MSQVFDGQSAWMITSQGVQAFPASQVGEFRKDAFRETIYLLTHFSSGDMSVQYLGSETVDGKLAEIILVTPAAMDALKFETVANTIQH